jgi:hypothetical protein
MRATLLVLFATCSTAFAANHYTDRMFRRALDEQITSPFYVLFTLNDPVTRTRRDVATTSNLLLGAIHFEYHIDFDEAGVAKATRIAASRPRHEFTFRSRKAVRNVQPYYSEAVLARVRQLLAPRSNAQLIQDGMLHTEYPRYELAEIYGKRDRKNYAAYRDATAHVLLERGILVGMDDISGMLYTEK